MLGYGKFNIDTEHSIVRTSMSRFFLWKMSCKICLIWKIYI